MATAARISSLRSGRPAGQPTARVQRPLVSPPTPTRRCILPTLMSDPVMKGGGMMTRTHSARRRTLRRMILIPTSKNLRLNKARRPQRVTRHPRRAPRTAPHLARHRLDLARPSLALRLRLRTSRRRRHQSLRSRKNSMPRPSRHRRSLGARLNMLRKTGTTSGRGIATATGVGIEAGMGAGIATMSGIVLGSVNESVIGNVNATAIGTFCEALRRSQPRLGRRGATKSPPHRPRSK